LYHLIDRITDGDALGGSLLDQVVTWEIKVLALLAGGVLAGANTSNGFKQGLFVGIGTALVLAGVQPYIFDHWVEATVLLFVACLSCCTSGGWFGSQLFPPLAPFRRRLAEMV
jgi:hypothetical protein